MQHIEEDAVPVPSPKIDGHANDLARTFLRRLVDDHRGLRGSLASRASRNAPIDEIDPADPIDDPGSNPGNGQPPVPGDVAAIAVLVARAIETRPRLLERLVQEAPVVVVTTNAADRVDATVHVLKKCIFEPDIRVVEPPRFQSFGPGARCAAIVAHDGTLREHRSDAGKAMVAGILNTPVAIVGVAPEPDRHLPRDLVRAAEYRIVLPALDQSAIDLVVEALFGARPTRRVDPELLRRVDVTDLPIAFRGAASADDCIDGIARLAAKDVKVLNSGPTLEELDGYGAAKDWGLALIADLYSLRSHEIAWSEVDNRSLLLSGPSGVGKTLFARALAKSADVPLIATSVAEWNAAGYLSQTLQAIRTTFSKAGDQAPCILFIDELDGISDRSKIRGEHVEYWTQVVNLVLEMLAGVEERPGVFIVAATNFPDRIDEAVKRAGRLDREIRIGKPDAGTLAKIFRHHLGPDTLVDCPIMPFALAARGTTGADVEAFVRRARGKARRAGRNLDRDDILAEIRQGRRSLSDGARRRLAIHEAGHAIVHHILGHGAIFDIALDDGGGEVVVEEIISGDATLPVLEDRLAILLAGRVAEELGLGAGSIGAGFGPSSDLARATAIARDIELRFGVGRFGPIHLEETPIEMSTVPALLQAVAERLERAKGRARAILVENHTVRVELSSILESECFVSGEVISGLMRRSDSPIRTEDPTIDLDPSR